MIKDFTRTLIARHSWPRPTRRTRYSACHYCDALHEFNPIDEGMAAHCQQCGSTLYQNRPASLVRATAFSLSALLCMVLSNIFPFMVLDASVIQRKLTLFHVARDFFSEGAPILGVATFLFTQVAPVVLSGGLVYVCAPLMYGRAAPFAKTIAKWMYRSEPWNMVEVFLLGVLVSLLKIAKIADIQFGIGFWAFAGVMLCTAAAVAGIDREELWDRIEVANL